MNKQAGFLQMQTPENRDLLVFEESGKRTGNTERLPTSVSGSCAEVMSPAVAVVEDAGETIVDQGEFVPGEPCLFFTDSDGYTVEIWYDIPTPFDPPTEAARKTQV